MTDRCCIRRVLVRRIALVFAVLAGIVAPTRGQVATPPQFEKDVLPVLTAHCVKCHSGPKPKAGLNLRTRAGMLEGGESGPALVPGMSARSLIFEMIRKGEMPPGKETKLTAQQVAVVKIWIDADAPSVQANATVEVVGKTVTEKDRKFWAFQKRVRPPVPHVRHVERVRTPIDAFILAKLESKSLTLSPDADRATLLRRVYFDLIGLPPSPEEVDAFLADTQPDAYERVVDRLLASPHYGERWGRHW